MAAYNMAHLMAVYETHRMWVGSMYTSGADFNRGLIIDEKALDHANCWSVVLPLRPLDSLSRALSDNIVKRHILLQRIQAVFNACLEYALLYRRT